LSRGGDPEALVSDDAVRNAIRGESKINLAVYVYGLLSLYLQVHHDNSPEAKRGASTLAKTTKSQMELIIDYSVLKERALQAR
jgi:hypothetical protein